MENSVRDLPNQVEVQVHLHLVDHLEVFQNVSGIKIYSYYKLQIFFLLFLFFLYFSSDIILEEPEAEEEDIMEEAAANVNCDIST